MSPEPAGMKSASKENVRRAHIVIEVPPAIEHIFSQPDVSYSFEDLLTESPVLIVGEKRYRGEYKAVLGTDLVFNPTNVAMAGFVGSNRRRVVFVDDDP